MTEATIRTRGETPGPAASLWQPRNTIANTVVKTATETHYGKRQRGEAGEGSCGRAGEPRECARCFSGDVWLASTGFGLLTSKDQGASWQGGPVMGSGEYLSVTAHGTLMAAARPTGW
jgi:hypothetical protein